MGLKYRGGRAYYYRSSRVGDRVVTEYLGGGELASLLASDDALEAQTRELERRADRAERERLDAEAREFVAYYDRLEALLRRPWRPAGRLPRAGADSDTPQNYPRDRPSTTFF